MTYLDASAIITLIAGRAHAPELRIASAQILEDALDVLEVHGRPASGSDSG